MHHFRSFFYGNVENDRDGIQSMIEIIFLYTFLGQTKKEKGGCAMKKIIIAALFFMMLIPGIASAQHTVRSGETLWNISRQYQMFYSRLIELNPNIQNPNMIYVGQKINIEDGTKADQIVEYALALKPVTKYVYGGNHFDSFPIETDCSGWTHHIYSEFGVVLPRVSWEQAYTGFPVKFDEMEKADLMFFGDNGKVSHVGIYMGDGQWISNLGTGKDVKIFSLNGSWTKSRFMWATRVI